MVRFASLAPVALLIVWASAGPARAEDGGRPGYCDHVEGAAAAESALLMWPELFGSIGYLDQPEIIDAPEASTSDDLRLTAGLRYRLSGLHQGMLTRQRAAADCRRFRALDAFEGETTSRALAARLAVLDEAMPEATRLLERLDADLRAHRATAQEVMATRLRIDSLRALASETRSAIAALPPVRGGSSASGSLAALSSADAEVERREGSLRRARAWDLSVRIGVDRFVSGESDDSPYFAVVTAAFNLGWLAQGGANARSAAGRRRHLEEQGARTIGATTARLEAVLASQRTRLEETAVLVADMDRQLAALRDVMGEGGRRYRQSLWFDWVKTRAEHAYLTAHVESLGAALGRVE